MGVYVEPKRPKPYGAILTGAPVEDVKVTVISWGPQQPTPELATVWIEVFAPGAARLVLLVNGQRRIEVDAWAYRFDLETSAAGVYSLGVEALDKAGRVLDRTGQSRVVTILAKPADPKVELTTLLGAHGFYVCAESGGGAWVVADRVGAGAWETFAIERVGPGVIALRASDGHYLAVELNGEVWANRDAVGSWEQLAVERVGDGYALKSAHGRYLSAQPDGTLIADRESAGEWETFASSVPLIAAGGGGGGAVQPGTIAGRLRTERGRFRNDAGFLLLKAISEFSFVHLCRTGRQDEVRRRLAVGQKGGCNAARIFLRAVNLFDLHDGLPGYWEAIDEAVALCNAGGFYAILVIGVDMNGMSTERRRAFFAAVRARYAKHAGVLPALSNEAYQNGWSGALDPFLLEEARLWAEAAGHRDFIIGDARDGDDPDASAETIAETRRLATHANILVIHDSRKGGAAPESGGEGRLRRHIDHTEGFFDVMVEARRVNPNAAGFHEERMGHASQRWVPIPGRNPYEREFDADCAVAAALTAHMTGTGDCYHRISEQDDGTPGLEAIGRLLTDMPSDPSWSYRNDSWAGSATSGFTWKGGKVRTWTNGVDAYVLAYGQQKGTVTWANGFRPVGDPLYDGPNCTVWKAKRS